nr:transcription initiation factor iia subunit 2 [Quercus suber]
MITSIGLALADTLDDLISTRRIEPQLAMRIMQNFDQSIAAVLGDKVKARLSFKACLAEARKNEIFHEDCILTILLCCRGI